MGAPVRGHNASAATDDAPLPLPGAASRPQNSSLRVDLENERDAAAEARREAARVSAAALVREVSGDAALSPGSRRGGATMPHVAAAAASGAASLMGAPATKKRVRADAPPRAGAGAPPVATVATSSEESSRGSQASAGGGAPQRSSRLRFGFAGGGAAATLSGEGGSGASDGAGVHEITPSSANGQARVLPVLPHPLDPGAPSVGHATLSTTGSSSAPLSERGAAAALPSWDAAPAVAAAAAEARPAPESETAPPGAARVAGTLRSALRDAVEGEF